MIYVFIDPSSKTTGYSIWDGEGTSSVPRAINGRPSLLTAGKIDRLKRKGLAWDDGVDIMVDELEQILSRWKPGKVVIEIPSGKVNPKRHGGGGSGLSVYGYAVGTIQRMCKVVCATLGGRLVRVTGERWTGGHTKVKRRVVAEKVWPRLRQMKDKGMDISDAIALGQWWFDIVENR